MRELWTGQSTNPIQGLLKVATSSFLITICGREQVAQVRGKPIYKITDVALVPLASQSEADAVVTSTREHLHRHSKARHVDDDTDTESEDEAPSVTDSLVEDGAHTPTEVKDPLTGQKGPADRHTSVAEDVIQKKGVYGRFANKWFSRKGWSTDSRRTQGLSSEEDLVARKTPTNVDSTGPTEEEGAPPSDKLPSDKKSTPDTVKPEDIPKALEGEKDATTVALLPRVLQTTKMYFSSGNFFFSYDYDLSHGVATQTQNTNIPLFKQYDPLVSMIYRAPIPLLIACSSSGINTSSHPSSKLVSIPLYCRSYKALLDSVRSQSRSPTTSQTASSLTRMRHQTTSNCSLGTRNWQWTGLLHPVPQRRIRRKILPKAKTFFLL